MAMCYVLCVMAEELLSKLGVTKTNATGVSETRGTAITAIVLSESGIAAIVGIGESTAIGVLELGITANGPGPPLQSSCYLSQALQQLQQAGGPVPVAKSVCGPLVVAKFMPVSVAAS